MLKAQEAWSCSAQEKKVIDWCPRSQLNRNETYCDQRLYGVLEKDAARESPLSRSFVMITRNFADRSGSGVLGLRKAESIAYAQVHGMRKQVTIRSLISSWWSGPCVDVRSRRQIQCEIALYGILSTISMTTLKHRIRTWRRIWHPNAP